MEYKYKLRVRYKECDMYGHVNHAVYLSYLENARIEFLKSNNLSITALADQGYRLFITHISIDYKNSAQFDDELEIITNIIELKKIWGKFNQQVLSGGKVIAEAEVKWACIDQKGKPVRIPDFIANLYTGV